MNESKEPKFGKHTSGMKVPDGFFADFQQQMEARIDAYEADKDRMKEYTIAPTNEPHEHRIRLVRRLSIAASVCLLLAVYPVVRLLQSSTPEVTSQTELTAEATPSETQEQMEQDMMLASVSDYDIYEYFYEE